MRGVDYIYSTHSAFAAVLKVGTLVTWGRKDVGGVSKTVLAALRVDKIYSAHTAFTAVLKDGCGDFG